MTDINNPATEASQASHLYLDVGRQVAATVRAGQLRVGDRLPSVRRLAAQHRVSIATAVQAYRYLEEQRIVEARPKSGFFVAARPRELPEPQASRPPAAARFVTTPSLLREFIDEVSRPGVIALGAGMSDPALFPGQRLARLTASLARRHPALNVTYASHEPDSLQLRRAVARRAVDGGWQVHPDELQMTSGAMEALNLGLRAVGRPGDTIAVESPTYFMFMQMIENLGMKVLEIPTHPRTGISLEALDLATQRQGAVRAVLLVPTYSNPLGSVMPDENKRGIVELCQERGIQILESDVYGETGFNGERPLPLKAWDTTGNVLYCSSFSKTVAPGMRVGWISAGRYHREVHMLKLSCTIFTPQLPQMVLAEFLSNGGYEHHMRKLRAALAQQAERVSDVVAGSFPEGTSVTRPTGGYVMWVEMPEQVDAVELFRRARAERIVVAPGPLFTTTKRYGSCIRIAYGHPWTRAVQSAIERVGAIARTLADE
jgi:DNA-binding transcriptional MocR family regulator